MTTMSSLSKMLGVLILTALLIGTTVSAEWIQPKNEIRVVLTDEDGKMLRGFSGDYEIQVQIDVATPTGIKTIGHYRIKRSGRPNRRGQAAGPPAAPEKSLG